MASPSISDLLGRAKAAPPEHRDVSVVLERAVAEQLDALNRRIGELEQQHDDAAAGFDAERADLDRDIRMADPRPAELAGREKDTLDGLRTQITELEQERDALLDGVVLTLRFTKLPGQAWSEITSRNPARIDVSIDRIYGYNYHETAKQAAPYVDDEGRHYGQRVTAADDGSEVLEDIEPEHWADLFTLLAGGEFERIATLLFEMNDWGPRQRAAAAKKSDRPVPRRRGTGLVARDLPEADQRMGADRGDRPGMVRRRAPAATHRATRTGMGMRSRSIC
jgi:hypothetical protein